jgi:glycosyltransferase involved in cell wall biosynthesis
VFILDQPVAVPYADPWSQPFEQRIRSLALKDKRVAYFYEKADTSTFRYRAYNMVQVCEALSPDISASYFFLHDLHRLPEILALADILVICRVRYSDQVNRLIALARAKNIKVLFDVDDFVFHPSYIHLILNTLDQDTTHTQSWDHWFAYVGRLGETLRLCDGAITTNDFLAARIHEFTAKPVSVIPNYLNREQLEVSEQLFQAKVKASFQRNDQLCLGYFSGTPTHNKDFGVVASALAQVLRDHPNVILRIVGFIDLKGELQNYQSRIELLPLQDFLNLQRIIAATEINLVPLQDNIFTNCKSELKFFEASAVGTVTIASPTFTFAQSIDNGVNGYLSFAYEWLHKINYTIANFNVYPEIAFQAYRDALKNYAWYNQLAKIETALFPVNN